MKFDNYYATCTVAVSCLIIACSANEGLTDDVKDNVENAVKNAASAVSNATNSIIPKCLFGVDNISYLLFTRKNLNGTLVKIQDNEIPFLRGKPVKLVIHGFVHRANSYEMYSLINTWLKKEDVNIFSVDWKDAACYGALSYIDAVFYSSAVKNVPVVGESVANFTIKLAREFGVPINAITILGHSLGAHVAGFAGKSVKKYTNEKYAQIVGLDPAGPLYGFKNCDNKLCASDATRVIAFHTSFINGVNYADGSVDFFFQGGNGQPGCSGLSEPSCDHARAMTYAEEAIKNPHCFVGTPWELNSKDIIPPSQCKEDNCAYAEFTNSQDNMEGVFYVTLSSDPPFCTPLN